MSKEPTISEDSSKNDDSHEKIASLKQRIFQVYHEVMKERELSIVIVTLLFAVVFLQLIAYAFDRVIAFPFQDRLYDFTSVFIGYLRIIPPIEDSQSEALYLLICFIMLLLIIIYFAMLMYIDYSLKIGKFVFKFPIGMASFLSALFYWVLLNPTIEGFLKIFLCNNGKHIILQSTSCWSGIHIVYCALFTLGIIGFIVVLGLIAFFYNEFRSQTLDTMSRIDNNFETYFGCFRIIVAVVSTFCRDGSTHWLLIIIYTLGALVLVFYYLTRIPYYNQSASEFFGACALSYMFVCFTLIIAKILENNDFFGEIIAIIIGFPCSYFLSIGLRKRKIYQCIFLKKYDKIKEDYNLDIYTRKLEELIVEEKHSEIDECVLYGYVLHHKNECTNPKCPLVAKTEFYLPSKLIASGEKLIIKDEVILLHLLNSIFLEYSTQPACPASIHIIYSFFLLNRMGNIHQSLMELAVADKCKCSFQQRLSIIRFKKQIEKIIKDKGKKGTDLNKSSQFSDVMIVINFESIFLSFQKYIEQSCSKYIEFWAHLNSMMPDLNLLHKLGLNIIYYSKKTHELWNKLCSINPDYPSALHIYGVYLKDIKNDEEQGNQYIEKEKKLRTTSPLSTELNEYDTMFSDSTAIIVISGSKESQGKITKTNFGVMNLLNFNPSDLIGKEVSLVMPGIIAQHHNEFLDEYFLVGRERVINKERKVFSLTHTKSLVYTNISVKLSPSVDLDVNYIALMVECLKGADFLITDLEGKIDSMTKSIYDKFQLSTLNFFQEYNVFIHLIFPELMERIEVNGNCMTKYQSLKSGDVVYINMIIPKSFVNSVQALNKYTAEVDEIDENESNQNKSSKLYGMFESSIKFNSKNKESETNALTSYIDYKEADFFEEVKLEINDEIYGEKHIKVRIIRITFSSVRRDQSQSETFNEYCPPNRTQLSSPKVNCIHKSQNSNDEEDAENDNANENDNESSIDKEFNIKMQPAQPIDNPPITMQVPITIPTTEISQPETERKLLPTPGNPNESNVDIIFMQGVTPKKEEKKNEDTKMVEKAKDFSADETGSMISSTKNIMSYIKKLRSAMYDKSVPSSVKQLKLTAQIVFLLLIGLTAAFYFLQNNIYKSCSDSIGNIYSAKNRAVSVAVIEYSMRMLYFLAKGIITSASRTGFGDIVYNDTKLTYESWTRKNLNYYADKLKQAQNNLSTSDLILANNDGSDVNPMNIDVVYTQIFGSEAFLSDNTMDCWSSMMSLVTHSQKISSATLSVLNATKIPDSASYILENSLNSILLSINQSSSYILNSIRNSLVMNDNVFKILLSAACAALIISMFILFPVAYKVARNKGRLLGLFMDITNKDVKEQLVKCKTSFNFIRGECEKQEEDVDDVAVEEDKKADKKEEEDTLDTAPIIRKKKKNFKPFQTKIALTLVKLVIFILFLASYFLYSYIDSNSFFSYIDHVSYEVYYIAQRRRTNSLLLYAEAEMIGTKGKSTIYCNSSEDFVQGFIDVIISEQEQLLRVHAQNFDKNDDIYNNIFDSIIYNNTCPVVFDNASSCYSFSGGLLQKGLHSANIAFWDNIREFFYDYKSGIANLLLDSRFTTVEQLDSRYFSRAYDMLQFAMDSSLQRRFASVNKSSLIVFIVYACIMTMVSYIFWSIFLKSTSNSLWVTKSMLSIIPPEIIQKVKKITDFLIKTASLSANFGG